MRTVFANKINNAPLIEDVGSRTSNLLMSRQASTKYTLILEKKHWKIVVFQCQAVSMALLWEAIP